MVNTFEIKKLEKLTFDKKMLSMHYMYYNIESLK